MRLLSGTIEEEKGYDLVAHEEVEESHCAKELKKWTPIYLLR